MAGKLGERLKTARIKAGFTQGELAELLGIAYPTLNKYERGHRVPGAELVSRMANLLDCDPGWLVSGDERPAGRDLPEGLSVTRTPVLRRVPEDFPEHVSEEISEYISLPEVPDGAYALIVRGESMSPTIKDGDYLIFLPDMDAGNGDMVVVNNEWGESMPRRYRKKNRTVFLSSDNPEYPVLQMGKKFKIRGKVIGVWRKVRI